MQTADITLELDILMNSIEKMLNGEEGEEFLAAIRKYKAEKKFKTCPIKPKY